MSFEVKRYVLLLSYIGTAYQGWQRQKEGMCIQAYVEEAIFRITREKVRVFASGRTDTGVHAKGQVAHFELQKPMVESSFLLGLNAVLPWDIRVLGIAITSPHFHARKHAIKKKYRYLLQCGPSVLPFWHHRAYWVKGSKDLDVVSMQEASKSLIGEHDFLAFCGRGSQAFSTIRKIHAVRVWKKPWKVTGYYFVGIDVIGSGFLKQMMRRIAGLLLEIGRHHLSKEDVLFLLRSFDQDQKKNPRFVTLPGCGLWLERVWYPASFGFSFYS